MGIKPQSLLLFLLLFIVGVMATSESFWKIFSTPHHSSSIKEKAVYKNFVTAVDSIVEERVYLQVDRPLYSPGDTIWFSAYVREGKTLQNCAVSDIVYVELVNPKGNVEKSVRLIAPKGQAAGEFLLADGAPGGLYTLKAYTKNQENEKHNTFFEKKITVQHVVLPRLKMRLDFLKKAYGPGDKVSAELILESNENKKLSNYPYIYQISLNGVDVSTGRGRTDDRGKAIISTLLAKKLESSDGLLNIIITYKGIRESISRSIPIVLNKIDLQFMPEGGELVTGLTSHVGFKACNEFGKPADIEGVIRDSKGKLVTSFVSFHYGMGAFRMTPRKGETYTAEITRPKGIGTRYTLPSALPAGYTLGVAKRSKASITFSIGATKETVVSLLMQMRGEVLYSRDVSVGKGVSMVTIPTADLPSGVAQVTLFDECALERAERLVFLNRDKRLNINVKTNKERYLPREEVKMTIQVTDDSGMPMPAQLSMAVVDDKLLSFMDDKTSTIQSWLLCESDIRGKVEEPRFYFDTTKAKSLKALDYLMMTSGWRRFSWKEMREGDLQSMKHTPEKAILAGRVLDEKGEPVKDVTFTFNPAGVTGKTNSQGEFSFVGIDLSVAQTMTLKKDDYEASRQVQRYDDDLTLVFYKEAYPEKKYEKEAFGIGFGKGGAVGGIDALLAGNAGLKRAGGGNVRARVMKRGVLKKRMAPMKAVVQQPVAKNDVALEIVAENPMPLFERLQRVDKIQLKEERALRKRAKAKPRKSFRVILHGQKGKITYFRGRDFYVPKYDLTKPVETRTDFRPTIYWNGMVDVSANGKAVVRFPNSDAITSFKTVVEGVNNQGLVGRAEHKHFTKKPLALDAKLPATLISGDTAVIELQIENSQIKPVSGVLKVSLPEALVPVKSISESVMLGAKKTTTLKIPVLVKTKPGKYALSFAIESGTTRDAFEDSIAIIAQGFPVDYSFSGREMKADYTIDVHNLIKGSMDAKLTVYPTVVNDLLSGIESILREPSGCFEQTSMSSYPNTMILEYLRTLDNPDVKLMNRAETLLDRGYKRLTTFETKEKGYEWFGGAPGHEALTAYGVLQFNDMKKVSDKVDEKMIKRTSDWLMNRRDGKGGFKRNARALDSYGGADQEITNAYIVYSLAEAGFRDILPELNHSYAVAQKENDPYLTALVVNALIRFNDPRAKSMLASLMKQQQNDGSWVGKKHSITRSTGKGLKVETTALVLMAAMLTKESNFKAIERGVQCIISSRSGYGGFGNTQSTVMALKALTRFANYAKKTDEPGTIELYVNGKKVASKSYAAGEKDPIVLDDIAHYFTAGKSTVTVKFADTKTALPYALLVSYSTALPNSAEQCVIGLNTKLDKGKATVGETVRLTTTVTNKTKEGQPMTVALVGIPAGLSAQPWQLKELVEKKKIDFYEIADNMVHFYYRDMAPSEVSTIHLDLKAELSGSYQASASSAYLYYTNEFKTWSAVEPISVQ